MKCEKLKILIIDDEYPARNELHYLISLYHPEAEISEAESGSCARELAAVQPFDAAFVDIHLGDMKGTVLAVILKELQPNIQIVFATAYDDYAVKAFELDALDYIMKPYEPKRVESALRKVLAHTDKSQAQQTGQVMSRKQDKLAIVSDKRVIFLAPGDIAYIESHSRTSIVYADGAAYPTNQTLSYFEGELSPEMFFRTHKSFLVNIGYIHELLPWTNGAYSIKLNGYEEQSIPVSRNQARTLKELFGF